MDGTDLSAKLYYARRLHEETWKVNSKIALRRSGVQARLGSGGLLLFDQRFAHIDSVQS